jgi:hypothetical protein
MKKNMLVGILNSNQLKLKERWNGRDSRQKSIFLIRIEPFKVNFTNS